MYSTGGTVLMFLVIGVLAGALTGVPIGPVNVAVIHAAYRHTMRRAIAVGLGGAVGDGLYSALGVLGMQEVIQKYPIVEPTLFGISGAVLLVYGILTARSHPPAVEATGDDGDVDEPDASDSMVARRETFAGFKVGLALIVLNPAAIATWVVIMGSTIPKHTRIEGLACTIGVLIGSSAWFMLVAFLTHRGKNVLGEKAAWIPRIVGIGLIFYAMYLLAKAIKYFAFHS
jgi:threonine/homoserine/homoserine lactone efflux protein